MIYIDTNVWDYTDTAYLPYTNEGIYYERKVSGNVLLDVVDMGHSEYVRIAPSSADNPVMWVLKYGYYGNNPDSALNNEYIHDKDIVVYYQGNSSYSGPRIYRKTGRGDEIYSTSGTLSGSGANYTFSVSSLSGTYTVVMVGNEHADFDLYARWNSTPTTTSYDAKSSSLYSSEYFTVTGSGTLYVMVRSYSGSGNWRVNILTHGPSVMSGRTVGTLPSTGSNATYSLAGTGRAWVYLAGPDSGDFDLYIKWGSPTTTSYDSRGYTNWSQEKCTATGSETLYYMVHSYSGSGEYSMLALIF